MQRLAPALRQDNVPLDLISLIKTILAATKEISFRVSQGHLSDLMGSTLDENIQGEVQKELDVVANELLKDILLESGFVKAISSEEEDSSVAGEKNGKYLVSFDPLDGSSNIEINSLIGTIFSIHEAPSDMDASDPDMFKQAGNKQLCAGYVLYGPSTMLVMTTGSGTHFYVLDRTHGGFLLVERNVQVPADTQEFAVNMSNQRFWQAPMQNYISDLLAGDTGPRGKNFNMRWIAAMVGDIHRVLTRGGIFTYPQDSKNPQQPHKLRLMYEANPMSFLIEQAGGLAMTSEGRIMDMEPNSIHQRVEVIMGSKNEVEACLAYYK
ncbi:MULTISPECIES: class 1 fructose-bisphosphatase [unclassified Colwellia]|jgi:fructose-1,6-bisphosphatase I|uniref:class 1 fructose-bisphosphatase n=1 Tax=unclassified Colwellia TaxID=196834 RepID=UPI0015F71482|nr:MULTISPECIES: class 1 fructose-bisphosphatase [unclassified Colwellia]MBA6350564.1 class 1 fructose-bisphosphatase [Colwellia sp. BRX9-1]MBA6355348.1 class 1 fructose-bisphosphatase [Colwellia sp. BRX8-3]MBA6358694.1 class 1 fructose-bisphosphatase [Colwellia sp. BRX8-6]MBA6367331.1 class 1 fructose-bisphosphatase [Colwellia sp. BRX8-5]MBA6373752.1 class 1 fructose-bisphosphatase [Colwellia sp. BRX8-2]